MKTMHKNRRRGLYSLMLEAGTLNRSINSTTVGYCLSPRINAAGRMGRATTWSLTGERAIDRFVRESGLDIPEYDAYYYGYPQQADEILDALLRGDKRATTSLRCLYELEKEPLPQVGQYSVILDSQERPRCITRIMYSTASQSQ